MPGFIKIFYTKGSVKLPYSSKVIYRILDELKNNAGIIKIEFNNINFTEHYASPFKFILDEAEHLPQLTLQFTHCKYFLDSWFYLISDSIDLKKITNTSLSQQLLSQIEIEISERAVLFDHALRFTLSTNPTLMHMQSIYAFAALYHFVNLGASDKRAEFLSLQKLKAYIDDELRALVEFCCELNMQNSNEISEQIKRSLEYMLNNNDSSKSIKRKMLIYFGLLTYALNNTDSTETNLKYFIQTNANNKWLQDKLKILQKLTQAHSPSKYIQSGRLFNDKKINPLKERAINHRLRASQCQ